MGGVQSTHQPFPVIAIDRLGIPGLGLAHGPQANDMRRFGRRRWLIAFGFGLVHGFGFSFALRDMLAFAGDHLAVSLLAFNLGVEFGQILVLAVLFPLLVLAGRYLPRRMLVIVLSAFVAHSGWHWVTERFSTLSAYRFIFPEVDQAFIAGGMRWLMLLLTAALLVWLARGLFDRFSVEAEVEQR